MKTPPLPPPPPSLFPRGRCFRKYTPARQTSSTSSLSTVQKKLQNASDFYAVPIPEILEDSTFLATNFPRSGASPFLSREERRKEERRKGKKLGSRGAAHKERIMQRCGAAYDALCRDATPVSSSPIANTTRNMCGGGLIGGMPWDRLLSLSLSTRLRINTITAFES